MLKCIYENQNSFKQNCQDVLIKTEVLIHSILLGILDQTSTPLPTTSTSTKVTTTPQGTSTSSPTTVTQRPYTIADCPSSLPDNSHLYIHGDYCFDFVRSHPLEVSICFK